MSCTPHNSEKKALNGLMCFLFLPCGIPLIYSSNLKVGIFSYFPLYLLAIIISICYTIFNKNKGELFYGRSICK